VGPNRVMSRARHRIVSPVLRPLRSLVLGAVVVALAPAALAQSQPPSPEPIPGQLIVRYEDRATPRAERRALAAAEARRLRAIGDDTAVLRVDEGDEARALAALRGDPAVRYAVQDGVVRAQRVPNDEYFGLLYGLRNTGQQIPSGSGAFGTADADIDADEAWDIRTSGATVAILDSGVDFSHPDLTCNMWTNPGESGGGRETDGIDNDGNGFIDDWRGWDFVEGNNDPTDDVDGHGSHVAGTVAACSDNSIGITGVAWSAPLMAVRVLGDDGSGSWSDVLAGFDYAGRMGARVANASLGGQANTTLLNLFRDEFRDWPGTLFALAAGNDDANLDSTAYAPCEASASAANAICVQSNDNKDEKAWDSNYGANATISAPGVDIGSICPASNVSYCGGVHKYVYLSGTSMATPQVAGSASLIAGEAPTLTGTQLRTVIENSADAIPALALVPGNRRMNVASAIRRLTNTTPPSPVTVTSPASGIAYPSPPLIAWTASSSSTGQLRSYEVWIDGALVGVAGAAVRTWQPGSLAVGAHSVEVRAVDDAGNRSASASVSFATVVQSGPAPSAPSTTTPAPASPAAPSSAVVPEPAVVSAPMALRLRGAQPVTLRAQKGAVKPSLQCTGTAAASCAMTLQVRYWVPRTRTKKGAWVVIGTLGTTMPAGGTGTKTIALTRYGRNLLRQKGSIPAVIRAAPRPGATGLTTTGRVRIRS
jgi:subtilisin family serine protease